MRTNYYAITPQTPEGDEGLHIGKHVGGREFLFRAHRDLGLVTVETWTAFLSRPGVRIVAEHGRDETIEEFMPEATKRPADATAAGERRLWPRSQAPIKPARRFRAAAVPARRPPRQPLAGVDC
ncbi:hypothetical protein [Nonomuraea sp. NPDC003201]